MKFARVNWAYVLLASAFIGFIGNILAFYPGFLSNDSMNQLQQAMGLQPVSDLLPSTMTFVWRILIRLFGNPASMLVLQLAMLWGALFGLSAYVFKQTQSRRASLTILSIGLLPFILNISGVIWKDTQMTFAALLATILIIYQPYVKQKKWKIAVLVGAACLIMYACLVRYNAIVALLPLVFFALKRSGLVSRLKFQLALTGGVGILIVILFMIINSIMHVQSSNMSVALILDDVANVSDKETMEKAGISKDIEKTLLDLSKCAKDRGILVNNLWVCIDDGTRSKILYDAPEEVKKVWANTVVSHPFDYFLYRLQIYTLFLFPNKDTAYIWQDGIVSNELGRTAKFERLGDMVGMYVNNFGYRHFMFLFEPWFWMMTSILILAHARRKLRHQTVVNMLAASSILYLLTYFLSGATPDYRYIYWPVLACIVAIVLLTIDIKPRFLRKFW